MSDGVRDAVMAIDRALAATPGDDDLEDQKAVLLVEWLGEDLAKCATTTSDGCLELSEVDTAEVDVPSAVWPFVRSVELWGNPSELAAVLAKLVAEPRYELGDLLLEQTVEKTEPLDPALVARIADATPRLQRLRAVGHRVVDEIVHPTVPHVVATGYDALGPLVGRGCFPAAHTLDVTLHPDIYIEREPPFDVLPRLVPPDAFPALVRLDLSRNEPGARALAPNTLGGMTPIFDVVEKWPIVARVAELRLPSLREYTQVERVQRMLDRNARLQLLEIARMYEDRQAALSHSTARIVVPPRLPWPAASALYDHDGLVLEIAGKKPLRVDTSRAHSICETSFATMEPAVRAAWLELWRLVGTLRAKPQNRVELAIATLATIASSIDDDDWTEWSKLGRRLEGATGTATMYRLDGYDGFYGDEAKDEADAIEDAEAERRRPPKRTTVEPTPHILELEAALQASFDDERLAVYADALLQHGDARGELIALDLQMRTNKSQDLKWKRYEVNHDLFAPHESELGFAHVELRYAAEPFDELVTGNAARYLGKLALERTQLDDDLDAIAGRTWPWLRTLILDLTQESGPSRTAALAEALPNLRELDVLAEHWVRSSFAGFTRPTVERLRITGHHALSILGWPWPAVTAIDFACGGELEDFDEGEVGPGGEDLPTKLSERFGTRRFPALHTLDLARNEPSTESSRWNREVNDVGGAHDVFALLADLEPATLQRLRHVRVPSLRTAMQVSTLQLAISLMPQLETLEVVRLYRDSPQIALAHPTARIAIPPESPWPACDQVSEATNFVVRIDLRDIELPVRDLVSALEAFAHALTPALRTTWHELWDGVRGSHRGIEYSAARISEAFAWLDDSPLSYMLMDQIEELKTSLRPLAIADARVRVRMIE